MATQRTLTPVDPTAGGHPGSTPPPKSSKPGSVIPLRRQLDFEEDNPVPADPSIPVLPVAKPASRALKALPPGFGDDEPGSKTVFILALQETACENPAIQFVLESSFRVNPDAVCRAMSAPVLPAPLALPDHASDDLSDAGTQLFQQERLADARQQMLLQHAGQFRAFVPGQDPQETLLGLPMDAVHKSIAQQQAVRQIQSEAALPALDTQTRWNARKIETPAPLPPYTDRFWQAMDRLEKGSRWDRFVFVTSPEFMQILKAHRAQALGLPATVTLIDEEETVDDRLPKWVVPVLITALFLLLAGAGAFAMFSSTAA